MSQRGGVGWWLGSASGDIVECMFDGLWPGVGGLAALDDGALVDAAGGWGALSIANTEAAIDALVDEYDPAALRRCRESASSPTVQFGSPTDVAGTTSMWARLYAPDAALIEARVEEMARSVCEDDPRTLDERRAAALKALAARSELACACGQSDCGAGPSAKDAPAKNAVVYVIAEQESVEVATEAVEAAEPADPQNEPQPCSAPPAFVFGGGVLPTPLLGAILDRATLREVRHPGQAAPEPRYTPSRKIAEFVRAGI